MDKIIVLFFSLLTSTVVFGSDISEVNSDSWIYASSQSSNISYEAEVLDTEAENACFSIGLIYGKASELGRSILSSIPHWNVTNQANTQSVYDVALHIQIYEKILKCDVAKKMVPKFKDEIGKLHRVLNSTMQSR
ncbi:MAG: hypothetical protein ACXVCY_09405 [Pseudobdellovibrionaceae bacterium]